LVRRAGAAKAVKPRLRLKKRMVSCMVAVARLIGDFLVGCRDGRDSEFFFFLIDCGLHSIMRKRCSDFSADLCRLYMLFADWL
jgi:hypothetical protein